MFLFVCNKCDHLESCDPGFANYPCLPSVPAEQLCTLCRDGKWHGKFERERYDPLLHIAINRPTNGGVASSAALSLG